MPMRLSPSYLITNSTLLPLILSSKSGLTLLRRRLLCLLFSPFSWSAAERACTAAISQHKSTKGYWRRAKARKMLNRPEEAAKGA